MGTGWGHGMGWGQGWVATHTLPVPLARGRSIPIWLEPRLCPRGQLPLTPTVMGGWCSGVTPVLTDPAGP